MRSRIINLKVCVIVYFGLDKSEKPNSRICFSIPNHLTLDDKLIQAYSITGGVDSTIGFNHVPKSLQNEFKAYTTKKIESWDEVRILYEFLTNNGFNFAYGNNKIANFSQLKHLIIDSYREMQQQTQQKFGPN